MRIARGILKPLLLLVCVNTSSAQSSRQSPQPQEVTITDDHGVIVTQETDGTRSCYLSGNVHARFRSPGSKEEQELRADQMLIWGKTTEKGEIAAIDELYAEGNVLYTEEGRTLRADRLYLHRKKNHILVIHLRILEASKKLALPFFLMAEKMKKYAQGRMTLEGVTLTTCTYAVPHFDVTIREVDVEGVGEKKGDKGLNLWDYETFFASGHGVTFNLLGVPLLWSPLFAGSPGEEPIRSLRTGRTKRYGTFVTSDLGFSVRKGWVDALNPFDNSTESDDKKKWGDLIFEVDYRKKRGMAFGFDPKWEWDGYKGYIDTYYLRDKGPDPSITFDRQFLPLEHRDRERARLFHRHEVGTDWRLEFEASTLSDRNLLPEFFEKEFKEGKEQESAAYARWLHRNAYGFVLERYRLNDFQTQTEMLPKTRTGIFSEPLFQNFTVTGSAEFAELRRRYDTKLDLSPDREARGDFVLELTSPWDLGAFQIEPLGAYRLTAFGRDIANEAEVRSILTGGGRANTQVYGVHPIHVKEIGLHGLRHIMTFETRYTNNLDSNVDPRELHFFDEIDRLDEFEEVALEWRHRFQTKSWMESRKEWETLEFLDVGGQIEYYPDPARDTTRLQETGAVLPFHWITVPKSPTGLFENRVWSNLHWDATFRPVKYLSLTGQGEYNPLRPREEVRYVSASFSPFDFLKLTTGQYKQSKVTDAVSLGMDWRMTEKWRFTGDLQYDFELERFIGQKMILQRDFHDFIVEGVVEIDYGRDERRYLVALVPKFFKSGVGLTSR